MSEEKAKAVTYDLSALVLNPVDLQPVTQAGVPSTIRDCIVTAFKMPTEKSKNMSEGDLNFRRLVVLKLERATDLTEVPLKSKAVQLIKDTVRDYWIPGIVMQIYGTFDGEPTQAQMDDV